MIKFNKNDKLLKSLAEEINEIPVLKSARGLRDLHLYGVASSRNVDVVTPNNYPYGSYLQNLIVSNYDIRTLRGTIWDLAEIYNNRVLGLGLNFRKNNYDNCKKVIVLHYLALNSMLRIPDKFISDNDLLGDS